MNKFMEKLFGKFMPEKETTRTTISREPMNTVDLSEALRKQSRAASYPRSQANMPSLSTKGTKKGVTHYVRPAGQGLSN